MGSIQRINSHVAEIAISSQQQNSRPTCCQRIRAAFDRAIVKLMEWLEKKCGIVSARVIGTLLLEPVAALRAGMGILFHSCVKTPHFHNVNPTTLKPEQLLVNPVLVIHGNYSDPSMYSSVAKALKNSYGPAVFTVKLKHGDLTEEDRIRVNTRIEEIKALFRKYGKNDVKIDLVGHSRGAIVANDLSHEHWHYNANGNVQVDEGFDDWTAREDIGKTIIMGNHGLRAAAAPEKFFEINGNRDFLIFNAAEINEYAQLALREPDHYHMVPAAHAELLYSTPAHKRLISVLRS
jgi:pimeloyl-ACP methyl ester carboxylesterase